MRRLYILFFICIELFFSAPSYSGTLEIYKLLNLFGDVFARVRSNYVEPVEDQKLIENALNGMLNALDPHSSYLNEKELKTLQNKIEGKFGGLGVEIIPELGVLKVIAPLDGSPADQAGILPGDYFIEIDDQPIMGMPSLSEAVEKLKGAPGTKVKLKIFREGKEPFDIEIVRDIIKPKPVVWRIDENIGVIRISTFINEHTAEEVLSAIKEIKRKLGNKLEGIIFDVRNNAGGLLEQALEVADLFLSKKEIVSIRGRDPSSIQKIYSHAGEKIKNIPLVILINNWTASAPEILAGALQDNKRAIVLGTRSFGKGSVQTVIPLENGNSAIRLTTARYFTPSGRSIQAEGIVPDIEVLQSKIEIIEPKENEAFREEKIPGALKSLIKKGKKEEFDKKKKEKMEIEKNVKSSEQIQKEKNADQKEAVSPESIKEKKGISSQTIKTPEEDYQLRRALDLLHGIFISLQKINLE